MLGSSPFVKTSPAWEAKKPRWLDVTLLTTTETGAKRFKTEASRQKILNKK